MSSILGNYYRRVGNGQLTGKEQRSAVSQVAQRTASLAFKRALMAAVLLDDVRIALPMHDAFPFEHRASGAPARVVEVFQATITDVLGGLVTGKASVGAFAASREFAVTMVIPVTGACVEKCASERRSRQERLGGRYSHARAVLQMNESPEWRTTIGTLNDRNWVVLHQDYEQSAGRGVGGDACSSFRQPGRPN